MTDTIGRIPMKSKFLPYFSIGFGPMIFTEVFNESIVLFYNEQLQQEKSTNSLSFERYFCFADALAAF